jgi:hypothetical protein
VTAPASPPPALIARMRLAEALDHVDRLQAQGADVATVVDALVRLHGAALNFRDGTNILRCCGVTGTCTSDHGVRLVASWKRIAERRLGNRNWPTASGRTPAPYVSGEVETQAPQVAHG